MINPKLYRELQDSYSNIRDILHSFPAELGDVDLNHSVNMREYDKKITVTYGMVEDLQRKIGNILDEIQADNYD